MASANPLQGAPRIPGEILRLGIEISQATVAKYMPRRRKPPSPAWRSFLDSHVKQIVGLDFFTVPTVAFHLLFLIGIEQVLIAARSPWQNPCAERGIGSVRRECLDHVIVLNERHLRRILRGYFTYYRESRTRLAPAKDSPEPCEFEPRGAFIAAGRGCWQAQGAQVLGRQRGRGFR
jgi:hypothetical protein